MVNDWFGSYRSALRLVLRRQVDHLDPPILRGEQIGRILGLLFAVADRNQVLDRKSVV